MKKWRHINVFFIIIIGICGCLCSCGEKSREVSENQIQYAVEDYLLLNSLNGSKTKSGSDWENYEDMTLETVHLWDKESNTDTVDVSITFKYPYGSLIAENTLTYQYDKSSDLWSLIRTDEWNEYAEYDIAAIRETEFSNAFTYNTLNPGLYWLYETDIDLETYKFTAIYGTNAYAYVQTGWTGKELTPACMDGKGVFELQDITYSLTTAQGTEKDIPALELVIEDDGCLLRIFLTVNGIVYSELTIVDESKLTYGLTDENHTSDTTTAAYSEEFSSAVTYTTKTGNYSFKIPGGYEVDHDKMYNSGIISVGLVYSDLEILVEMDNDDDSDHSTLEEDCEQLCKRLKEEDGFPGVSINRGDNHFIVSSSKEYEGERTFIYVKAYYDGEKRHIIVVTSTKEDIFDAVVENYAPIFPILD